MITKFLIKNAIAGGTIYYTKTLGVWDSSDKTSELYEKIATEIVPLRKQISDQIPLNIPALPVSNEIGFVTKHYYNEGVKNSIYFIHRLPCYIGQYSKKASDAIMSAIDPVQPGQAGLPTERAAKKADLK